MAIIKENPAGDANANSEKLLRERGLSSTGISTSKDNLMNYAKGGIYAGSSGGSSNSTPQYKAPQYSSPQNDITAQMEALKQAQLRASMAGLDKSRQASLSNLQAERATIEPEYQKQKMQAGVTAKQTARSFDEYMAQRGGNQSGIAGQGQLLNNVAYQGQKGVLDQGEAMAMSDNARRVTGVNNAYESDVVGAQAGIEAQYLQNYIQQMNADRAYGLQEFQVNNQAEQFAQQFGLSQQQFANTINQQGIENAYRDKSFAQSADQFAQQMGLSREQFASQLDQWSKSFNQSNSQWQQSFDYGKTQDAFQNGLAMQQLELQRQNAARAASGGSSGGSSSNKGMDGGKYSDSATASMKAKLDTALANGMSTDEALAGLQGDIKDGTARLKNYDADYLYDYIKSRVNENYTKTSQVNMDRSKYGF